MPMMRNMPAPMTREQLLALLRDITARVEAGDSFEGSLEYLMPTDEEVPEGTEFMVQAAYRTGNLGGQGGMRLIGEMREVPDPVPVQVRHDSGELQYFTGVQKAVDFASEHNGEVWKVSFPVGDERVRLVRYYARNGRCFWVYQPILDSDQLDALVADD